MLKRIKEWAGRMKLYTVIVYFAAKDSEMPLLPKIIALATAAYAFSPIDLIPDFIPLFGYLDDVLIVPIGIWLVLKFTPDAILVRAKVSAQKAMDIPKNKWIAIAIVLLWILIIIALIIAIYRFIRF